MKTTFSADDSSGRRSWIEKVKKELAAAEGVTEAEAFAMDEAAAQLASLTV